MALQGGTPARDALDGAITAIAAAGCETPRLDAELLLANVLGVTRERLITHPDTSVEGPAVRAFQDAVRRRAVLREPVAYIVGKRGFRRLELAVDARALVPRPETELLVEVGLSLPAGVRVLDVGTGSGAVALALKDERPDLDVTGSDVSEAALELAQANGRALGLDVSWLHADLLDGVPDEFDAVLSNPPYIADGDRASLAPEIVRHEPAGALFAGSDGLDAIRALAEQLATRERVALVALEIGTGQAQAVQELIPTRRLPRRASRARPRGDRACDRRRASHAMSTAKLTAADAGSLQACVSGGGVAVFPTDTVYGVCCDPDDAAAAARLYELKGRPPERPAAVMFFALARRAGSPAGAAGTRERGAGSAAARAGDAAAAQPRATLRACLRSGSRYRRAARAAAPDALAALLLGGRARDAVERQPLRCIRRAHAREVPPSIREGADLVLDGGELPGTPSTVIDLRDYAASREWCVVREGLRSRCDRRVDAWRIKGGEAVIVRDEHLKSVLSYGPSETDSATAAKGARKGSRQACQEGVGSGMALRATEEQLHSLLPA